MKFELFPLDILNKIVEYLDIRSCLAYFRLSKRFLSLDTNKFWEIRIEKDFTLSPTYYYNKQKYNYIACKYRKLRDGGIIIPKTHQNRITCVFMEEGWDSIVKNRGKLRDTLINYLKKTYPNNFKTVYGKVPKELCTEGFRPGEDTVKEARLFAAANDAYEKNGSQYNLILTQIISCEAYAVYDSVGFINMEVCREKQYTENIRESINTEVNIEDVCGEKQYTKDIHFKIMENINNRITFPSCFNKFMDALGLDILDAWQLYDIPDNINMEVCGEKFSLPYAQIATINRILPEENMPFAEDKITCDGHIPVYSEENRKFPTLSVHTSYNERIIRWEEICKRNSVKITENKVITDMPPLED